MFTFLVGIMVFIFLKRQGIPSTNTRKISDHLQSQIIPHLAHT